MQKTKRWQQLNRPFFNREVPSYQTWESIIEIKGMINKIITERSSFDSNISNNSVFTKRIQKCEYSKVEEGFLTIRYNAHEAITFKPQKMVFQYHPHDKAACLYVIECDTVDRLTEGYTGCFTDLKTEMLMQYPLHSKEEIQIREYKTSEDDYGVLVHYTPMMLWRCLEGRIVFKPAFI